MENDYRSIFETPDLTANPEILWFKMYDGDQVGNSVTRYLNTGGGNVGVTASLVDDYLTIDGRPLVGKELLDAKRVYPTELLPTVRDPRLSQTVALPGQRMQPAGAGNPYVVGFPLVGWRWFSIWNEHDRLCDVETCTDRLYWRLYLGI